MRTVGSTLLGLLLVASLAPSAEAGPLALARSTPGSAGGLPTLQTWTRCPTQTTDSGYTTTCTQSVGPVTATCVEQGTYTGPFDTSRSETLRCDVTAGSSTASADCASASGAGSASSSWSSESCEAGPVRYSEEDSSGLGGSNSSERLELGDARIECERESGYDPVLGLLDCQPFLP